MPFGIEKMFGGKSEQNESGGVEKMIELEKAELGLLEGVKGSVAAVFEEISRKAAEQI